MGNAKCKLAAFPLAACLFLSAITPCFAAEAPAAEGNTEAVVASATNTSDLVPIERSQAEINGEMVIEEVFEVPAGIPPESLVKEGFATDGFYYTENSIVKTPFTESKEKEVEKVFTADTQTKDMAECIKLLPFTMQYDEENYVGTLYLDPQSIAITPTEQKTKSSTSKKVMTYDLEMNDPSQVPSTYAGLPRTSLTWEASGYIEDSSIPSGYTATAVYSKTTNWKEDSAWQLSATYSGTATYENTTNIRYTVTYKGAKMESGDTVVNGVLVPKGYQLADDGSIVKASHMGAILPVLITIGVIALIAAAVLFLLWAIKRGIITSRKIKIQAQDDATGEYTVIQKVRVNKKAPAFTLDTLKAPSSQHFMCTMSGQLAMKLRGKIINVSADGQVVAKHKVEPLDEKSEYVFTVDLVPVDAGPVDTFAL